MLDRFHKLSEIVAAFAIVGSLIFVGIQVNQNTDALETNATQISSQTWQNLALAVATNPQLAVLYRDSFTDNFRSNISPSAEGMQVNQLIQAQLKSMEFNYLQWRDGNLSDEMFVSIRSGYLLTLEHNPIFEQIVMNEISPYTASFRAFTGEALEEIKQRRAAVEEVAE